jgi:hypothetical protein
MGCIKISIMGRTIRRAREPGASAQDRSAFLPAQGAPSVQGAQRVQMKLPV